MSITTRAPYGAETFYMPEEAFRLNPIARAFGQQPLLYGGGGGGGRRSGGKGVIAAVASIAVPFAAPAIAGAIAKSAIGAAVANTVGMAGLSAATGAVLGAGVAAATGGNVGRGALFGGIGGGIAGYGMPTPGATGAGTAGGAAPVNYISGASPAYAGTNVPTNVFATPQSGIAGVNLGAAPVNTAATFGNVATPAATFSTNVPTNVFANPQSGIAGVSAPSGYTAANIPTNVFATPQPGIANVGGGGAPAYAGTNVPTNVFANPTPNVGGSVNTATAPVNAVNTAPAAGGGVAGGGVAGGGGGGGAAGGGVQYNAAGQAINPATGQPYTVGEALRSVPGQLRARFSDPKALADLTLRAAGAIYANEMGGGGGGDPYSGLTDEEKQLLKAQMDELNKLRTENQALFNQRLEQAQSLIGESKYFDPEYFGLQRARRAQLAGARAKRAGLRGLTGAAREAEARRFDLATGRDTGTAYDVGYGQGISGRLQTKQAGISMMPTAYPSSSSEFTNLANAYGNAADRSLAYQQRQAQGAGNIFAPIFG